MFEKLIYLYVLLLPLMKLPKMAFMGDKMQYADLVFIPLFLLYLFRLFRGKIKFIRNRLDLFLILLITISFLSHLSSTKGIFMDFVGLVYLVCLYFVFTNLINNRQKFNKINLLLFIATSFVCIWGILSSIFYNIFNIEICSHFLLAKAVNSQSSLVPFARISSFINLPEMFINFILLGLSSALIYRNSLQKSSKSRLVDFFIILIILTAFFALSRSLVGMMLFLTLIAFHFSKKGFIWSALRTLSFYVFILLLMLTVVTSLFLIYPISLSKDSTSGMVHLSFNSNLETRVYLTKAALAISKRYPFLGLGLGSFANSFREFLSKDDISILSNICRTQPPLLKIDPHSLYFGALAEIGYLGTAVLLFILFLISTRIIRAYKLANGGSYLKNSCYISLSAFLGYLLNGFFVDILSMRSFWVLLSLGIVAANLTENEHKGIAE